MSVPGDPGEDRKGLSCFANIRPPGSDRASCGLVLMASMLGPTLSLQENPTGCLWPAQPVSREVDDTQGVCLFIDLAH